MNVHRQKATRHCRDLFSGNNTNDANRPTEYTHNTSPSHACASKNITAAPKNNTSNTHETINSLNSSLNSSKNSSLNSSLTTITKVHSEAPEHPCSKLTKRLGGVFGNLCDTKTTIPSNVILKTPLRRRSSLPKTSINPYQIDPLHRKPPLDTRRTAAEILRNNKLRALSSSRGEKITGLETIDGSEKDSFVENTQFSSLTQITSSEMDSSDQQYTSECKYDNVQKYDKQIESGDNNENEEYLEEEGGEYFEQGPEYLEYEYVDGGQDEYFDFERAMQDNKLWNQIKAGLITLALVLAGVSLWFSVNTWRPELQDDKWLQRINEDLNAFLPENSTNEVLDLIIDDRCKF